MVRATYFRIRRYLITLATGVLALGAVMVTGVVPASAAATISNFAISSSPPATVFVGASGQAASTETFTLPNTFTAGNTIVLTVSPSGTTSNNCTTSNSVTFGALPKVTAVGNVGNGVGDTAPTITPTLTTNGTDTACTTGTNDVLTLTLPATVSGSNAADTFTVTISGVVYNVGSAAVTGPVVLAYSTNVGGSTVNGSAVPNAVVLTQGKATAAANNPVVQVTHGAAGTASNLVVTETAAGGVTGSICVTVSSAGVPFTFSNGGTASASTGAGHGVIGSSVSSSSSILAPITTTSTAATTYTISAIGVANGGMTGPAVVTVTSGGSSCANETASIATALNFFNSTPGLNTPIAGTDTDATAIAELAAVYPAPGSCPVKHAVILATDQNFPDALAASYLAGFLGTGVLLTPTGNLSSETQKALQVEGITTVYPVGGLLALSQNTLNQVAATPAYNCGGTTATGSNITVTPAIAGQTQYDTAEQIAVTPGSAYVASINLSGAYTNAYNDTSGMESSAPSATGTLRTAIVASGANFPDATAASVMALRNKFPMLLTDPSTLSSQTTTGLQALGIKQVIVLGGPLAVSDAVVTAIQALGISVIRIAGQDPTDTAQQLANFELNTSTNFAGLGWGAAGQWGSQILVARGDFYADALAGCVLANLGATPILLTENPTTIGQYLTAFLNAGGSAAGIDGLNSVSGYSGNILTIQPLGGPLALQFNTLTAMVAAVGAG